MNTFVLENGKYLEFEWPVEIEFHELEDLSDLLGEVFSANPKRISGRFPALDPSLDRRPWYAGDDEKEAWMKPEDIVDCLRALEYLCSTLDDCLAMPADSPLDVFERYYRIGNGDIPVPYSDFLEVLSREENIVPFLREKRNLLYTILDNKKILAPGIIYNPADIEMIPGTFLEVDRKFMKHLGF